jgi:WXXGXW repeat (2 copies)
MGTNPECRLLWIAPIIALVGVVACHTNSEPDPAATNLAPADQYAQQSPEPQAAEAGGGQQLAEAPQPPPPLPSYTQPQCPGENYIWTPGYWSYSDAGYYWVPGVWVMAPYVDALWTPPYWDFYGGAYRWHAGYWSRHIGFYGGINYGFGYTGLGFYGGYWDTGGRFIYNRDVTRIDTGVVKNYYSHSVVNYTPFNRVSYNGPGGISRQPVAAELAVRRENRMNALPIQVEHMRTAAADRSQFAAANRGRPATAAIERPLAAPYSAPAANRESFNRTEPAMPRAERGEARGAPQTPPAMEQRRLAEPRAANPAVREMPQPRPEQRMPQTRGSAPQSPPEMRTPSHIDAHPAPPPHQNEAHPAPPPHQNEAHPAPPPHQNEAHPAPPRQETKPAPFKEDHGRRGNQ